MEEKIIREWVEKAKPLVDSAWNLALEEAIRVVDDYEGTGYHLSGDICPEIIKALNKLKKPTQ